MYDDEISYELVFLNRIFFSSRTWAAGIIIFLIIAFMAYREEFHEYALRNTHYLIVFTFLASFFWYWMAKKFELSLILVFFGISKAEPFYRFEGYLSIIVVIIIYYFSAFVGCALKKEYQKHIKKLHDIHNYTNHFEWMDKEQEVME